MRGTVYVEPKEPSPYGNELRAERQKSLRRHRIETSPGAHSLNNLNENGMSFSGDL
jgi:hypothetical protein